MKTNSFLRWTALCFIAGAFSSVSALASYNKPQYYQSLTAVELAPGQAPRLQRGFSDLAGAERRYGERLPLQLRGPMKKVQSQKYQPRKAPPPKGKTSQF
jgi:hypothetical protein